MQRSRIRRSSNVSDVLLTRAVAAIELVVAVEPTVVAAVALEAEVAAAAAVVVVAAAATAAALFATALNVHRTICTG